MAIKFYLQNAAAPPISLSVRGGWNQTTGGSNTFKLGTTKAGAVTSRGVLESSATATNVLVARFISDPVAADTLFCDMTGAIVCLESASQALMTAYMYVYVTVGDTDVVRSVIKPLGTINITLPTTAAGRTIFSGYTQEGRALAGDRIVIELGYRAVNTSSTFYTGTFYCGGTGTDASEGSASTTSSWVQFATRPYTDDRLELRTESATVNTITGKGLSLLKGGTPTYLPAPASEYFTSRISKVDNSGSLTVLGDWGVCYKRYGVDGDGYTIVTESKLTFDCPSVPMSSTDAIMVEMGIGFSKTSAPSTTGQWISTQNLNSNDIAPSTWTLHDSISIDFVGGSAGVNYGGGADSSRTYFTGVAWGSAPAPVAFMKPMKMW